MFDELADDMALRGHPRFGPQLRETLARITEAAAGLLEAEGAGLRLVVGSELLRVATFGPAGGVMTRERLQIGESLSGRVVVTGQPLILNDAGDDPTHDPVYRATAAEFGFRSWLGVPLRVGNRVVGVLVMQSRAHQRFGPSDARLLEVFAGQAAVAIENAWLFEEERERRRQLEAVRQVTLRLAGERDLAPLLDLICQLTAELLAVHSVVLYLWNAASEELVPRAWHGFGPWLGELRLRLGEGLAGTVAQRRAGLIVDDYGQSTLGLRQLAERGGINAVMAEPLLFEGELRGVIAVVVEAPGRTFHPREQQLLGLFAAQAAIAIEQARLLESRDQALAELELARGRAAFLADASALLSGSLNLETTLSNISTLVVPAIADWCLLDLVESDGSIRRPVLAHSDPSKADLLEALRCHLPNRADLAGTGRVLADELPRLYAALDLGVLQAIAHSPEHLAILQGLAPRSAIVVPLQIRGRILGALMLATSESRRPYDQEDLRLAEGLARRVATAVENADLYTEAQQAIKARDEFVSVAAHELRTPLTTLHGYAQVALRSFNRSGQIEPGTVNQAFQVIVHQAERLNRLISQLLDISRLQLGRLALEPEVIDLGKLVQTSLVSATSLADNRQIQTRFEARLFARVDTLRMEQVMSNLLENAMRYSPAESVITVELRRVGRDTIEISVQDQGSGIPVEKRSGIFDRYFRAHADEHSSGMGLGLFISREIVERHGGAIRAEFPAEGGSRFVVSLPMAGPQAAC